MSRRSVRALFIMVGALLGFNIIGTLGEFFTAPQTPAAYLKSQLGMRLVERDVRQAYTSGGLDQVEKLGGVPQRKLGFAYTVTTWKMSSTGYDAIEAHVSLHYSPDEAALSKGRTFYDKDVLANWSGEPYAPLPSQQFVSWSEEVRGRTIELGRRESILLQQ